MECNRDEALRAKTMAESKLIEKDIESAWKLASKAHNLFPELEGLSQFVATLNVYVSAEKKINGEPDFYKILCVDPLADDEIIRKNYRKLALALHPDKNKSTGADGAFKILSEAWSLLSDKAKRTAYDLKRNLRVSHPTVTTQNPPMRDGTNGFHSAPHGNFPNAQSHSAHQNHANTSNVRNTQSFHQPVRRDTFWTSCWACNMHYEYERKYLNQRLLCPTCRKPFLAAEKPFQGNSSTMWPSQRQQQQQQSTTHSAATVQRGPSSTFATKNENLRRPYDDQKSRLKEEAVHAKTRAPVSGSESSKIDGFVRKRQRENTRESTQVDFRSLLVKKARKEILKQLDDLSAAKAAQNKGKEIDRAEEKQYADRNDVKNGKKNVGSDANKPTKPKVSAELTDSMDSDVKADKVVLMNVPDPDFHNFDKDRTERSFAENQVWAVYDDDDGMPRYYVLIHRVISKRPFKVEMSWLNTKSNAELGPMNWVGSGFPKTCGDFRIGKHIVSNTLNSFSHKVNWTKAKRGAIQIFPRKGDVWALYKNWSADWNELTADDLVRKYEMVEVLEDYSEEQGVIVAPLIKTIGFKSVFHKPLNQKAARKIPKEEIFRLSHQVPSYLLTEHEAQNGREGSRELDPAALPLELLQVVTAEKFDFVKNETAKEKPVITYFRRRFGKKSRETKGKEMEETKDGEKKLVASGGH